ncbi:hypothetical protein CRM22_007347 [Opisthorchis felineus]|nr:hypothetical protein CRM22_007347 [Opisthorchis felineus]
MRGLLVRAVCLGRTFVGPRLSMMNYRQLQDLHTRLSGKGLRILAFPCNQFGNQVLGSRLFTHRTQEPWPEAEIKRWVSEKFGVTFDMFSKIDVNGSNAHPLFKYLKKEQHGFLWNFGKFLVDRTGKPRKRYSPQTDPLWISKFDVYPDFTEECYNHGTSGCAFREGAIPGRARFV